MPLHLLAADHDAHDPDRVAEFWAALLHRQVEQAHGGLLLAGDRTQLGLHFVAGGAPKLGANRMHLHLTSTGLADQQRVVDEALALGASHHDVGQLPEEGHVVLADPEGNELCVIPPDSDFLAGCGFLGELACDGTRDLGVFWSEALGWPLVWDQDGETAIQSPAGGTKIAWGGPPLDPRTGPDRQRLLLAAVGDLEGEVERLLSLGATRPDRSEGAVGATVLADPDGNELRLVAGH